jgi:hypothetical protein
VAGGEQSNVRLRNSGRVWERYIPTGINRTTHSSRRIVHHPHKGDKPEPEPGVVFMAVVAIEDSRVAHQPGPNIFGQPAKGWSMDASIVLAV